MRLDGYKWSYKKLEKYTQTKFQDNVIVGCQHDSNEGTIRFTKNYKDLGEAFKDPSLKGRYLIPTISIEAASADNSIGNSFEFINPVSSIKIPGSKDILNQMK